MGTCSWAGSSPLMQKYHDQIWGREEHDPFRVFEALSLEMMQAGLSWEIILRKVPAFEEAFDQFDYFKVAQYDGDKVAALLQNEGIVRNRRKIEAVVSNARIIVRDIEPVQDFGQYIWDFAGQESDEILKALKAQGFRFVGKTVLEAFLEAIGFYNHHEKQCNLAK